MNDPSPKLTLHFTSQLALHGPTAPFLTPAGVALLEQIALHGSIAQAARIVGLSYKKAWELVADMKTPAGELLVQTQTGGSRGGGAIVTPEGQRFIAAFRGAQARLAQFLAKETARLKA